MELSKLNKTWILDIDGTIVRHNGHLSGKEHLLEGVKEFFSRIDGGDKVVFITSRKEECRESLEEFLEQNGIRFDCIIYGAPVGERILVNDIKPSGLRTAFAVNKNRDEKLEIEYKITDI